MKHFTSTELTNNKLNNMKKLAIFGVMGVLFATASTFFCTQHYYANQHKKSMKDYQIYIHNDTLRLYDYDRLVGESIVPVYEVDSLIMKDNQ